MTMILNIFTPHFANLGFQLLPSMKRCFDRGCSCNSKNTKKVT